MKLITYGPGGFQPEKPHANKHMVVDDETRTVTDYTSGKPTARKYTKAEHAEAIDRAATQ